MGWQADASSFVNDKVQASILGSRVKAADLKKKATGVSLADWRFQTQAQAGALACTSLVPGPAVLAAVAAEIGLLLRLMSVAALGTGFAMYGDAADDDYLLILAVWAKELNLDDSLQAAVTSHVRAAIAHAATSSTAMALASAIAGPAGAAMATQVGTKITAGLLSSVILAAVARKSTVAATPLIVTKISTIIVSNIPVRLIPFVGAGVCAAVNLRLIGGILDAAETYYNFQDRIRRSV
jgi:hypothetical protein